MANFRILAAVAVLAAGCSASPIVQAPQPAPVEEQTPTRLPPVITRPPVPFGSTASEGKFGFTVVDAGPGPNKLGDAIAEGTFYIVRMQVKNWGTSPVTWVAAFQKLVLRDGSKISPYDRAPVLLNDMKLGFTDIAPGQTLTIPIYFDFPGGGGLPMIEVHETASSTGVQMLVSKAT